MGEDAEKVVVIQDEEGQVGIDDYDENGDLKEAEGGELVSVRPAIEWVRGRMPVGAGVVGKWSLLDYNFNEIYDAFREVGVMMTPVGIKFDKKVTFEHMMKVGQRFSWMEERCKLAYNFGLGDWWNSLDKWYGKRSQEVERLFGKNKIAHIKNLAHTARMLPMDRRSVKVRYSIQVEIATMAPEEQQKWIHDAEHNSRAVTVERLRIHKRQQQEQWRREKDEEARLQQRIEIPEGVEAHDLPELPEAAVEHIVGEIEARRINEYADADRRNAEVFLEDQVVHVPAEDMDEIPEEEVLAGFLTEVQIRKVVVYRAYLANNKQYVEENGQPTLFMSLGAMVDAIYSIRKERFVKFEQE